MLPKNELTASSRLLRNGFYGVFFCIIYCYGFCSVYYSRSRKRWWCGCSFVFLLELISNLHAPCVSLLLLKYMFFYLKRLLFLRFWMKVSTFHQKGYLVTGWQPYRVAVCWTRDNLVCSDRSGHAGNIRNTLGNSFGMPIYWYFLNLEWVST